MQVGTPTDFARRHRTTMSYLLVAQLIVLLLRMFFLSNIIGIVLQCVVVLLGWYTWTVDLHITYMCVWGVFCFAAGCYDTFVCLVLGMIGFLEFTVIEFVLRFLVPASEFAGALFACLIFCSHQGLPMPFGLGAEVKGEGHQSLLDGNMMDIGTSNSLFQSVGAWRGAYGTLSGKPPSPINTQDFEFGTRTRSADRARILWHAHHLSRGWAARGVHGLTHATNRHANIFLKSLPLLLSCHVSVPRVNFFCFTLSHISTPILHKHCGDHRKRFERTENLPPVMQLCHVVHHLSSPCDTSTGSS